jgi:hypothetical protein
MRVPFDPTAFPGVGRTYLAYELYLTNFSGNAMTLRRLDVMDADSATARPVASFEGAQLDSLLQSTGARRSADEPNPPRLGAGATVIAFIWISLEAGARLPNKLRHRILTAESLVESALIGTQHTELHVLGPPVQGSDWSAPTVRATTRTIITGAEFCCWKVVQRSVGGTPPIGSRRSLVSHSPATNTMHARITRTGNPCSRSRAAQW